MLPEGSYNRIMIEAVSRGQREIVDWVHLLMCMGDYESLGIDRKAVLEAAIEAGDLEMIKLFYDSNVDSATEAIVLLHKSGYISEIEILDYFLGMEDADPVRVFQERGSITWWPDCLQGFEHLGQDPRLSSDSISQYFRAQVLYSAVKLGSLPMVKRYVEFGGLRPAENGLTLLELATRVHPPAFDVVEYLLRIHMTQPFSTTTDLPAFTNCLFMAVTNGSVDIVKLILGLEGFQLGDRQVLIWAAEAGQVEVVRYLLTTMKFNPLVYNRALTAAVENNRPGVVQVLLDSGMVFELGVEFEGRVNGGGQANNLQDLFFNACCRERGAIVRLFVESGIIDPSYSDAVGFQVLCIVRQIDFKENLMEERDDGSDWTESDTSSVFDGYEDDNGDCAMELDDEGDGELNVDMAGDLFDNDGIRKWEFNHDDNFRESERLQICQYLIDSGKVLRPGLTTDVLMAGAALPPPMFRQVMDQCRLSLDAIDDGLLYKALQNAICGQQLENLRLILTTRASNPVSELLMGLIVSITRGGEVFGFEILKHLTVGSVEYRFAEQALEERCCVDFIMELWRFLDDDDRWKFFDLVVEKERWDIVKGVVGKGEGGSGFFTLEIVKARGTNICDEMQRVFNVGSW
ncbi:hypothetical protein HDU76_006865 [Blyttiomyces sp. JEL0837]|nr:hypothetical protein HDU76_006865 [Blyttiomyces sp. JEL0837]